LLTEHTVAEAAGAARFPAEVHFKEITGSTNTDLIRLADQGAPEWTAVVAAQQEAGRGRLGRSWISPPGSSLLVSVLVRPLSPPSEAALVTLGAGACMASIALTACGIAARCKWPNDLVVAGRKLGGVLVESSVRGDHLEYAVIGTGVNVRQSAADFPPELRETATSIALQGGLADPVVLLRAYLERVREFCDPADPGLRPRVLGRYRRMCDTLGRTVRATTMSGRQVEGRAMEIGEAGELILETPSCRETVTFGEIAHLD
jgi:BirA family biotin operon repressor/biotin-[acetyl-CoA-carboxylase] ligase